MRNCFSGYKLMLLAIFALSWASCERINGIDNNNVIVKPFALFVSDTSGLLWISNDGDTFVQKASKTNDGMPMRAIATSGNNILFVKVHGYVSENNGNTFNPIDMTVDASPWGLNQAMVIQPKNYSRIFMAGDAGNGIIYSDSNGKLDTWVIDRTFDASITNLNFNVSSFTQTKDGKLYALDPATKRLFFKSAAGTPWQELTMGSISATGNALYLAHFNNTLIIADYAGSGIWYSYNAGATWTAYAGLPTGTTFNIVSAPFELTLLVGTGNAGVYRYDPTTNQFLPSNNGLDDQTNVRSITGKDRVYKKGEDGEGLTANFIFLATHSGVYRSNDLGQNWFLVKRGKYTAIY